MFGALRLKKKGLTAQQKELYQAHFCASCHAMDDLGGWPAALLTNYDQTFLTLVYAALERHGGVVRRPCTAVKLRQVPVQELSPQGKAAVAALNMALIEAKLRDDVSDEKRLRHRMALRFYSRQSRKAEHVLRDLSFPYEQVEALPVRQAAAEADPRPTLASLAAPTADLMGEVFAFVGTLTQSPQHGDALRDLGGALGRFLYVWDAYQDATEDARRGRFNALVAVFGGDWDRQKVRNCLQHRLAEFRRSVRALPLGERAALAEQLMQTIQERLDRAMPAPKVSFPQRLLLLNRRLQHQRGDCDCAGCGDCGQGCDCCSGCCEGVECCICTGPQLGCGLLIVILLVIVIIILMSRRSSEPPPPVPAPRPAITQTTSTTVESPSPTKARRSHPAASPSSTGTGSGDF